MGQPGTQVQQDGDSAPNWLTPLEEAANLGEGLAGRKAMTLGTLAQAGLPVPRGFVLTAAAWRSFARAAKIDGQEATLARQRCRLAPLPADLTTAVDAAIESLGPGPLAVRSAALDEDGALTSAAGQFHTSLDVEGRLHVHDAIRACWQSLFDEPALAYCRDRGLDASTRDMAVIIQRQIQPQVSGVLFTRTEGGQALVEAVAGPCRLLVDGSVNPVRYSLPADLSAETEGGRPGSPIKAHATDAMSAFLGSAQRRGGSPVGSLDPLLPRAALTTLFEAGQAVESLLGEGTAGADIEWAWADGHLHILQARPITRAVPAGGGRRVRWVAANSQEALLDPVTPLTWSLLAPLVEAGRRDLFESVGFAEIPGPGYMRLFYGLPYFNPDYFRAFLKQIPGAPETIFDALIFGDGRDVEFRVPQFNGRTARILGLFVAARFAARERFEIYQRLFSLRLASLRRPLGRRSDAGLLRVRRQATDLLEGALRRHVLGTAISGGAYLLLDLFLNSTGLSGDPLGLTARLTSGASGNVLAVASRELETLARQIAAAAGPEGPDAMLERLGDEGGPLAREFRAFLARHGHRCEKEAELLEPRWGDDPKVLLAVLTSYVHAAEGKGHALARLSEREAQLSSRARELAHGVTRDLAKSSWIERALPVKRLLFRWLLREARRYAPYRENLKDRALRALHLVRRVFLEVGARLTRRGLLDDPSDVFFLEVDAAERALLISSRGDGLLLGLKETVAAARAERDRQLGVAPPPLVLETPGQPPQPVHATLGSGRLLEGVGVSGGKVSGIARVLSSMDDAARLAPGEVLVARVINAGWTPLFHLTSAIVAEVGGVLSHGAIVAREYGIPAVFGASGASRIPDGARILVDGDLGIVTVEAPPEAEPPGHTLSPEEPLS